VGGGCALCEIGWGTWRRRRREVGVGVRSFGNRVFGLEEVRLVVAFF